jgi:hypothetical protein
VNRGHQVALKIPCEYASPSEDLHAQPRDQSLPRPRPSCRHRTTRSSDMLQPKQMTAGSINYADHMSASVRHGSSNLSTSVTCACIILKELMKDRPSCVCFAPESGREGLL